MSEMKYTIRLVIIKVILVLGGTTNEITKGINNRRIR